MYITVTMRIHNKEFDIQADDHLPIIEAAKTLDESFGVFHGSFPHYFKSSQHGLVSGYCSFSQAEIHSGDILTAIDILRGDGND